MAKILCIDDEPDVLKTLAMILTRAGYEVFSSANADSAVEAYGREQPDLVIMDCEDSRRSSDVCLSNILRSDGRGVRCVYMASRPDLAAAPPPCADFVVCKPTDPEKLLATIADVLARPKTDRPDAEAQSCTRKTRI